MPRMNRTNEQPHVLLVAGPSTARRWLGRSAMALLLGVGGVGLVGTIRPAPAPYTAEATAPEIPPVAVAPRTTPPEQPEAKWVATSPGLTVALSVERTEASSQDVPEPAIHIRERDARDARPPRHQATPDEDVSVLLPGRLFISSRPWGRLYVDDRLVGTTPVAGIALAPGTHHVRVVRDGFQSFERTITVAPEQAIRLIDIVLEETRP